MASIWDLLPASLWPVQPIVWPTNPMQPSPRPPEATPSQALAAAPAFGWAPAPAGPTSTPMFGWAAASPAPANAPAYSGATDPDAFLPAFPDAATLDPARSSRLSIESQPNAGHRAEDVPPLGPPASVVARTVAQAPKLPPWARMAAVPLSLTGALAAAFLLGSTSRTVRREDDEFHPQYVVRGGVSAPKTLQEGTDELSAFGMPGVYGISSTSAPNMTVDQLAAIARYRHPWLTYTIVPELNGLGYQVAPTETRKNPLHASILLPPGQTELTNEQAAAMSATFARHKLLNPYRGP
jgi:hypothetical protein